MPLGRPNSYGGYRILTLYLDYDPDSDEIRAHAELERDCKNNSLRPSQFSMRKLIEKSTSCTVSSSCLRIEGSLTPLIKDKSVSSRGRVLVTRAVSAGGLLEEKAVYKLASRSEVYDDCANVVIDDRFTFTFSVSSIPVPEIRLIMTVIKANYRASRQR